MLRTLKVSDSTPQKTGFLINKQNQNDSATSHKFTTQYGSFAPHVKNNKAGDLYHDESRQDLNLGVQTISSGHKFSLPVLLKEK